MLGAAGLLIVAYVAIAANPYLPINPYPPPTAPLSRTPSQTAAEPTQTPAVAINPVTPTNAPFVSPTPLRPATPRPTPTPPSPFAARVERGAASTCNETILAGAVLDAEGKPLEGYPVHVWGPDVELIVTSGSAPDFGPSGWSVALGEGDQAVTGTYYVQLHKLDVYRGHPPLSPAIAVRFTGACSENVAIVYFEELGVEAEQGERR